MDSCGTELMDVLADLVEDRGRRRARAQPQREAKLAIEVAAPERRVVAVGQTKSRFGEALSQRAQDARLADARLASEQDVLVLVAGLDEAVDASFAGGWDPEVVVGNLL